MVVNGKDEEIAWPHVGRSADRWVRRTRRPQYLAFANCIWSILNGIKQVEQMAGIESAVDLC